MLIPFESHSPVAPDSALIAPGAALIGDVVLGDDVSIWFGAVLRGDINSIRIGARSNLQDGVVAHVNSEETGGYRTLVAEEATVGHRAILHGCRVGRRALVGMGAIILDGAEIGEEAMVAAGAVTRPGMKIPPRVLVRGVPGRIVRPLSDREIEHLAWSAKHYVELKNRYLAGGSAAAMAGAPA